jgi:hypothetical protein
MAGYGGSRGSDYTAPQPMVPEFGRIEYGHAGYYERAPRYGWDLDAAASRPDGPR